MADQQGRVNRKKSYVLPRDDKPPRPPIAPVRCPACGETCNAFEFDFLDPAYTCPSCGAPLTPAAFDQAARETCDSLDRLERERWAKEDRARELEEQLTKPSWRLRGKRRKKAEEELAWLGQEAADIAEREEAAKRRLHHLAVERHRTDPYFAATRSMLTGSPTYRGQWPRYDRWGRYWVADDSWRRVLPAVAEQRVFDALFAEAHRPGSPIEGAALLANVFLPHPAVHGEPRGRVPAYKRSKWAQVDVLVLARQAAILVEVKDWGGLWTYDRKRQRLFQCADEGTDASLRHALETHDAWPDGAKNRKDVLTQSGFHADAMARLKSAYPDDRILELVCLVDPDGFVALGDGSGSLVSAAAVEGPDASALVSEVDLLVRGLPPVMTEQQVEKMARTWRDAFGDLDHTKEREHLRLVKAAQAEYAKKRGSGPAR